jgi:transcriptional regulator with XRE-family HTH domain
MPVAAMMPQEFQRRREEMGLTRRELAGLLGYRHGNEAQAYMTVKKLEIGEREISPMCSRLLTMIHRHWSSTGRFPEF